MTIRTGLPVFALWLLLIVLGCGDSAEKQAAKAKAAAETKAIEARAAAARKATEAIPVAENEVAEDSKTKGLWSDANVATLTFTMMQKSDAHLDASKFPKRDYAKKFNDKLDAIQKSFSAGDFGQALALKFRIQYSELVVNTEKGEVRVVLALFRDEEAKWPKGDGIIDVQVWGVRKPADKPTSAEVLQTPLLKYDLIMDGKVQPDGIIKGKMAGVVFVDELRSSFSNLDFELKPGG